MKNAKIRLALISLIAIIMSFVSQSSLAFYSTVGKAENVVTSGNIRLIIHEQTDGGNALPSEGMYVIPGDVVSKKITVENDCEHPFYLRVKIVYGIDSQELTAEDCFKLNINEEYWEYENGWYYFKGTVSPGQTTPCVFSHVEIVGSKVDNNYIGKTLTLSVIAQAVQSENNPIQNGEYHSAAGWPADV